MSSATNPSSLEDDSQARAIKAARALQDVLDLLSPPEREAAIRVLLNAIGPRQPSLRSGELLGTIIRLLPKNKKWTVEEIKKNVEDEGVKATDKQVFNVVGYLTRTKRIKRIGYGRYLVEGVPFVSADDLGGQPSLTEGEPDD